MILLTFSPPIPFHWIIHKLQVKEYNEWFSIAEDARLAKSIRDALVTDAAYLDAFITAEEAATEDRIVAELLSRGEALPVPKSCQTRLEHPAFAMDPVMDAMSSDLAKLDVSKNVVVENGLLNGAIDNKRMHGESVGNGDHLMQHVNWTSYSPMMDRARITRNGKISYCVQQYVLP